MFKKVKKSNGVREFYFGKKKIFEYVNSVKFVEVVEGRFTTRHDFNMIYDILWGGGRP